MEQEQKGKLILLPVAHKYGHEEPMSEHEVHIEMIDRIISDIQNYEFGGNDYDYLMEQVVHALTNAKLLYIAWIEEEL